MAGEPTPDSLEKNIPSPPSSEEAAPGEDFAPAAVGEETAEEKIQKLEAEKKQLLDQLLRKQAELENFRKRVDRDKEEHLQYALFNTVKTLLPILDGFELALQSDGGGEEYRRGVELIYQQFYSALQKLGLEAVESKGREFDPHLHEAIATMETDQYPDHEIVEELQRGYFFKQRLLRPALVKVARRPAQEELSKNPDGIPE